MVFYSFFYFILFKLLISNLQRWQEHPNINNIDTNASIGLILYMIDTFFLIMQVLYISVLNLYFL